MRKLCSVICSKYRKFEKPKISYLLQKALVLFIICGKSEDKNAKYLEKKNQMKY